MNGPILILDYGMGNLFSLKSALSAVTNRKLVVGYADRDIEDCSAIVMPGVGSFAAAAKALRERDIPEKLSRIVIEKGKPILGICLGMQLLCEKSSEDGENLGFNLFPGKVEKFSCPNIRIPHVGFNQVSVNWAGSKLLGHLGDSPDFYFTHSYRVISLEKTKTGITDYGGRFVSYFENENVFGAQFHPELSQSNGLSFLKKFTELEC